MRRFCRFWILSVLVSFAVANRIVASGGMIVISEHFASESVTNRFTQSQSDDKKMLYDRHISRGDSLMQLKQYENAMWQFQRAAELLPFEEYPRLQMQKIEAIIGVQQLEERKRQKTADFAREDSLTREQSRVISEDITKTGVVVQKRDSVRNQIISKYKSTLENIEAIDNDEKARVYSGIAQEFKDAKDHSMALEYYNKLLAIEENTGNKAGISDVLTDMAEVYLDSGLYHTSIQTLEKSVSIKQEIGDEEGASKVLNNLGKVFETTYDFDKALDRYEKSAEVKEKLNDKKGLSNVLDNIGNIYYKKQILEKSIDSYQKSADLNERLNNPDNLGATFNKMGVAYYELGNYDEAAKFYQRSLDLKKQTGNDKDASMVLNNLGNINYYQNKFQRAISYYEQSLDLKENTDYAYGKAVSYFNLGNAYRQIESISDAIKYYEACKNLSFQNNYEELLARSLKVLSQLYQKDRQEEKAAEYERLLATSQYQDVDIEIQLSESQIMGETDVSQEIIYKLTEEVRKQKEIAEREAKERARENLLNSQRIRLKNEQIKRQRIILASMIAVIALVIGVLGLIYYQMIQKKKANKILTEKNTLISKQAKLITDNIKSASAIQRAAMPPDSLMKSELPEYFVLNMPKDIVSGDFYWMEKRDGRVFIAVADCTGHGVQGAVVSMLGMALLNEIVNKSFVKHPGEILNQLSVKLKESLHASGDIDEIREGMDIVLLKFDKSFNEIEFAGANNPVYVIRNNDIIEYRGDRSPIGYYSKEVNFTNQNIKLQPNDSVYMFSDGFIDQLSGENYKKYLAKRFKALLVDINDLSLEERKKKLLNEFHSWKGNFQQVDDVMILCMKI
ncbi:MAG TPA: tetratricopeptide repeat protein [Bacteroidales bacterium]|nr:tetratricopeptide repeat protein [Bacteroidales bacterium]